MSDSTKMHLMVNFAAQKFQNTDAKIGSPDYQELLAAGYVRVGEIKNFSGRVFIMEPFFNSDAKYNRLNDPPRSPQEDVIRA